jgi:hypothetical protein
VVQVERELVLRILRVRTVELGGAIVRGVAERILVHGGVQDAMRTHCSTAKYLKLLPKSSKKPVFQTSSGGQLPETLGPRRLFFVEMLEFPEICLSVW